MVSDLVAKICWIARLLSVPLRYAYARIHHLAKGIRQSEVAERVSLQAPPSEIGPINCEQTWTVRQKASQYIFLCFEDRDHYYAVKVRCREKLQVPCGTNPERENLEQIFWKLRAIYSKEQSLWKRYNPFYRISNAGEVTVRT
jgi:hypothetical protein